MKLTCTQENLARGLLIANRGSDKSVNLPILNNALLKAGKEGLQIITTNLELAIKTTVRGKIESAGDYTINTRLVTDFVTSLKKENIEITLQDDLLQLTGDNHSSQIKGLPASDFPVIPEVSSAYSLTVGSEDLKKALEQVVFAASSDESRPELNGVYWNIGQTQVTMAATDSYRLAECVFSIIGKTSEPREIIVPVKTMREVERIIGLEEAKDIQIFIDENQIQFTIGLTEIVSRLVTGSYPDYKQIIPQAFKNEAAFSTQDMLQAIKSTSLFCKQGINDIRLGFDGKKTEIVVSAENSIAGKNSSRLPVQSENRDLDVVFNYKYLIDGLRVVGAAEAALKTNDGAGPALLLPKNGGGFSYIIMPIKQ